MKQILFVLLLLITVAAAYADTECDIEVGVSYETVYPEDTIRMAVQRGDDVPIDVKLKCNETLKDVQVQAFITGYEHGSITDFTPVFDVKKNTIYKKSLSLKIPEDLEVYEYNEGEYKLRVVFSDRDGASETFDYNIQFEASRHDVMIRDILLNPSEEVVAGRGLIAAVRMKNFGQRDEESVKLTVSIPALRIEDSDYIDELEIDESVTSEDLFLRIPKCSSAGTYTVRAEVEFDDGYDTVVKDTQITVQEDETCALGGDSTSGGAGTMTSRTVITVPKEVDVKAGGQAVYPIIITNNAATSKQYILTVSGHEEWGKADIEGGSLKLIGPKQTVTTYIYLASNADATDGKKVFVLDIESANEKQSAALSANVVAGEPKDEEPTLNMGSLMKGPLELALIGLIILLVVIGLLAGFSKLKER
jgi:hypothetical protein